MTLKKYVISMVDSPRTEKFINQSFGKGFEIFDAADGRKSEVKEQFSIEAFKIRYGQEPKPGEIGCAVSHYSVMKKFVAESQPGDYALIAEDDAVFVSNVDEIINNVLATISNKIDVVALGYPQSPGGYRIWHGLDERELRPSIFFKDVGKSYNGRYRLSTFHGRLWGTGFYLIGYDGAQRYIQFVENCKGIYWVADDWNYFAGPADLNIRVVKPSLVGWLGGSEIRQDNAARAQSADLSQTFPLRTKLALKSRVMFFPKSLAAGLRDIANKIANF